MDTQNIKSILPAVKSIGILAVLFLVNLSPFIIFRLVSDDLGTAVERGRSGAEKYGLKITQFFIPTNSHGIDILDKLVNLYNSQMPLVNENRSAYLGLAGIIGFCLSMLFFFMGKKFDDNAGKIDLTKLSKVSVFGILVATIGGFGSMAGLVITWIRGYNRISILLSFIYLIFFLVILDFLYKKIKANTRKTVYCCIAVVIALACSFDVFPYKESYVSAREAYTAEYLSDNKFIQGIEDELGENAMVYQLPYHKYPESGSVNDMGDYQLFAGYINSDTLKWSYGSIKGSKADNWNENTASLPVPEMIEAITEAGFTGLYIDTRAYSSEELSDLLNQINLVLGETAQYSDNGNLIFYNLNPYIAENGIEITGIEQKQ